jgi:hypothetical protein
MFVQNIYSVRIQWRFIETSLFQLTCYEVHFAQLLSAWVWLRESPFLELSLELECAKETDTS